MNFNNTWRNYAAKPLKPKLTPLMEQYLAARQLILEGRLDIAKTAAPRATEAGDVDNMLKALMGEFGQKDAGKYLLFAAKALEQGYSQDIDPAKRFKDVLELLTKFHMNQNRKVNRVYQERLPQRDINKYNFRSLSNALYAASGKQHADENAEFVYKANGISALRPLTTRAACFLGGPNREEWCITRTEKKNFFSKYTEEESKAFVLVKLDGIPVGSVNHQIVMQFSGPGEPEFEMWWDGENESHADGDLEVALEEHIEGMGPDFQIELQDDYFETAGSGGSEPAHDLFLDLHEAAFEVVKMNPPEDILPRIERQAAEEAAAFRAQTQNVELRYEVKRDLADEISVFFEATLKLEFYDERFEEFLKDKDKNFYASLGQDLQTYMEQTGMANLRLKDFYEREGSIMVELGISADTAVAQEGYNLEGFVSFLIDAKDAEQTDGPDIENALTQMIAARAKSEGVEPLDNQVENTFYKDLEKQLLGEEKGRSRQRGIYKFHCMVAYTLTTEGDRSRGLDDVLADLRALPNVTIVTVAIRNQKIAEGRYIAGLAIKFIPSVPGDMNQPEQVKARIVRDIKRLENVQSLFKLSAGLIRLE